MMNKYYVYIHVKDGKVIYCGKGIKKVCNCGILYDRAYNNKGRKYNVKEVEVDSSCIAKCCKGKRKSVGKIIVNGKKEKLHWKYKEDK